MKIDGHPIIKTLGSYFSRVNESRPSSVSNNVGLRGGQVEDPINLSAEAIEFNRIKSFINEVPEIRKEKVEALINAIKNGRYYISPELIEPRLLKEHIMDALLTI
jgi:anti-sigma28 factor (negative regulator of flagellin synthesis)